MLGAQQARQRDVPKHEVVGLRFIGRLTDTIWYLDGDKAFHWWHRIAVHQDWHLQGWQRDRIYPDFLACLHDRGDGKVRFTVLETKGEHQNCRTLICFVYDPEGLLPNPRGIEKDLGQDGEFPVRVLIRP